MKDKHVISTEAKQRAENYMSLKGALEPKQETLEEAAEILYPFAFGGIGNVENDKKNHFIKGAKWQQERMYSEEDLKEAFKGGGKMSWTDVNQETQEPYYYDFKEWFEQFKKK